MKKLTTLISVCALTFASASAMAAPLNSFGNHQQQINHESVHLTPMESKQEAYQAALNKLSKLQGASNLELEKMFNVRTANLYGNKTHLNQGGFVTVQERMNAQGKVEYVGVVNVELHHTVHSPNS